MKKELDSINHQIDGLILAIEERKARFDNTASKLKKEAEFRVVHKIILEHTCSINMLRGVKELLNS